MGKIQPLIGNPYNWYINPYYWVDEFIPYYMEIMGVDRPWHILFFTQVTHEIPCVGSTLAERMACPINGERTGIWMSQEVSKWLVNGL